jgi:hypothetical protein
VYTILKIAVRNGNYDLYIHIASKNNLSWKHHKILSNLKKVLWETDTFNSRILESLVCQYGFMIYYDDILNLIRCKNMTVIECIIDLIDNRKIVMDRMELSGLVSVAQKIFPECVPLLESV